MSPTVVGPVSILNTTPHAIRFAVGDDVVEVPPCGVLVDASVEQTIARTSGAVAYFRTVYRPSPQGQELVAKLERDFPGTVLVGSVVAAQAYPGRVFSLIPVPGLERIPTDQKRCRSDAFGTFE